MRVNALQRPLLALPQSEPPQGPSARRLGHLSQEERRGGHEETC